MENYIYENAVVAGNNWKWVNDEENGSTPKLAERKNRILKYMLSALQKTREFDLN